MNGLLFSWHTPLSPYAFAEHGDLGISGKHHPRLAAMLPPSVVPKLHPGHPVQLAWPVESWNCPAVQPGQSAQPVDE